VACTLASMTSETEYRTSSIATRNRSPRRLKWGSVAPVLNGLFHDGLQVTGNWNSANDFILYGKGGEFAEASWRTRTC
jgi:hypothetical protein